MRVEIQSLIYRISMIVSQPVLSVFAQQPFGFGLAEQTFLSFAFAAFCPASAVALSEAMHMAYDKL